MLGPRNILLAQLPRRQVLCLGTGKDHGVNKYTALTVVGVLQGRSGKMVVLWLAATHRMTQALPGPASQGTTHPGGRGSNYALQGCHTTVYFWRL